MSEATRNTAVGLTAIVGAAIFGWLVFVFGEIPAWAAERYDVRVHMQDAGGITSGSRVKLRGIDVGIVRDVHFRKDVREGVELVCAINRGHRIPAGSVAVASIGVLGGSARLNIQPEGEKQAGTLPTDGSAVISGRSTSVTGQLRSMTARLGKDLQKQLDNFGRATDRVVALADQYKQVGDRVASLLEDRSPQAVDRGEAKPNLVTAIARADARLAELKNAVEGFNKLFADKQLRADIQKTAGNARRLVADARKTSETAREQINKLSQKYVGVADDLSKTLGRLDRMLAAAEQGDGTVARLLNDPALYESMTDAAQRLSAAVKEAQLLLKKWKSEGVPVQF